MEIKEININNHHNDSEETPSPCRVCCKAEGYSPSIESKLNVSNYFSDLPLSCNTSSYVEVQFKNTRKGYFLNSLNLDLHKGDMVAVEACPGHDIGQVTLTGRLVDLQMKKLNYRHPNGEPRRVYRLAKPSDIDLYEQVKALEHDTMIRSRQIAASLGLDMKIGDVEYQGDGMKAIFYYIAEGRVDFRQLIRKLADAFKIRVEMKQIGARQEAGRIGGLGPCGRQLCCSGWMTNFVSVGTNAARLQNLSLNPQKLAGQCAKLKCCLNFEADVYCEAQKQLPPRSKELVTSEGEYRQIKADALAGTVTYVPKQRHREEMRAPITISRERAFEVIEQNEEGKVPFSLSENEERVAKSNASERSKDILQESSLSRFEPEEKERSPRRNKRRRPSQKKDKPVTGESAKSDEKRGALHRGRSRKSGNSRRGPRRNNGRRPKGKGENTPNE